MAWRRASAAESCARRGPRAGRLDLAEALAVGAHPPIDVVDASARRGQVSLEAVAVGLVAPEQLVAAAIGQRLLAGGASGGGLLERAGLVGDLLETGTMVGDLGDAGLFLLGQRL